MRFGMQTLTVSCLAISAPSCNRVLLPGKGKVEAYVDGSEAPLWASSVLCNFSPRAHSVARPASGQPRPADTPDPAADAAGEADVADEADGAASSIKPNQSIHGAMSSPPSDHFAGYLHALHKITPETWAAAGPRWDGPARGQFAHTDRSDSRLVGAEEDAVNAPAN